MIVQRRKLIITWMTCAAIMYIVGLTVLNRALETFANHREYGGAYFRFEKGGYSQDATQFRGQGRNDSDWLLEAGPQYQLGHPFPLQCRGGVQPPSITKEVYTEVVKQTVFVYSSFIDTRTHPFHIRIMAVVVIHIQPDLFCHFRLGDTASYLTTPIRYYEMCENHLHPYGGKILHCVIPDDISPKDVCSVVTSEQPSYSDKDPGVTLYPMLTSRQMDSPELDFAVCVPPLFGEPDPHFLVEFFEMTKLLGANKIFIYLFTSSPDVVRVVTHYKSKGDVIVIPWMLPTDDSVGEINVTVGSKTFQIHQFSIWYHGQSVAINDCLYRTMADFRFTVFNDLDEFLIPKGNLHTWQEMMVMIYNDSWSGYTFKSAFFDPNSTDLFPLSHARRPPFSDRRNKVMVQPLKVNEVGIHHVSSWLHGYEVQRVPTDIAYIHHITKCKLERRQACNNSVTDPSVHDKYGDTLRANVNNTLNSLGLR